MRPAAITAALLALAWACLCIVAMLDASTTPDDTEAPVLVPIDARELEATERSA